MSLLWMSGPIETVKKDAFTNGPAPWHQFRPNKGDIIIAKNIKGETVVRETYDGVPLNDQFNPA